MRTYIKIQFLSIFISAALLACVSEPVSTGKTANDTRETSVMIDREQTVIEVDSDILNAAFDGQADELVAYIEDEEDLDVIMKDLCTAMLLASVRGHSECVQVLIESGVEVDCGSGGTALMWAAGSRQDTLLTVKMLLEAGADVNAKTEYGSTALIDAARQGNIEIVRLLLDSGAEVYAEDIDGRTAMTEAAAGGYEDIVRLLEDAEAGG
jgi:ankyrin repeat protein